MLSRHAHAPVEFSKLLVSVLAWVFGFILGVVFLQGHGRQPGLSANAGQAPAPVTMEPAQVFDYFPSHYENQAKDIEPQPETF